MIETDYLVIGSGLAGLTFALRASAHGRVIVATKRAPADGNTSWAQGGVAGAPVLVVVGGDTRLGDRRVLAASIFPATQNMLLAAGALGLGAALTTLPLVFGDELAEIAGFPFEVQPMAVVPLGWPSRPLGPPRRLPVAEKAHRETFGSPW